MTQDLIIKDFDSFLSSSGKVHLILIAQKMQKYHNIKHSDKDTENLDKYDEDQLRLYIKKKIQENVQLSSNIINVARLIYGDFESLCFDYYETFINRQSDDTVKIIFNNVEQLIKSNKTSNTTVDKMRKRIVSYAINNQILQNPQTFDSCDEIIGTSKEMNDTIKHLQKEKRSKLVRYALAVQMFLTPEKIDSISPIINVASKNEIIRYIMKLCNKYPQSVNARKLDLLSKQYYLDYGEDSIFEISEY